MPRQAAPSGVGGGKRIALPWGARGRSITSSSSLSQTTASPAPASTMDSRDFHLVRFPTPDRGKQEEISFGWQRFCIGTYLVLHVPRLFF